MSVEREDSKSYELKLLMGSYRNEKQNMTIITAMDHFGFHYLLYSFIFLGSDFSQWYAMGGCLNCIFAIPFYFLQQVTISKFSIDRGTAIPVVPIVSID